ncbi:hypothetical protein CesoFtcFv8_024819 [Champsocephalus esox]|uniref:Cytochrome P450 n=1 Tax=Champsocephalus esox TaxID=159716 RepID=A0AAN8B2M0_9TELE|nr:hypothetical protein CesoFtcFv8_024819 [Champsocephalus esox]
MKSVLNEEGQWTFPHEFNPESVLNDEGEFVQPEAFVPFCAGPRMCPGERLAQMKFFFIIVTLLRKFKFIWPEDAGEPDYTPVMGVTLSPHPYRIKVQLRTTQYIIFVHTAGDTVKSYLEQLKKYSKSTFFKDSRLHRNDMYYGLVNYSVQSELEREYNIRLNGSLKWTELGIGFTSFISE